MSCICGIIRNNEIWIAGDSAGSDQYSIALSGSKKVFRKEVLYGSEQENIVEEMIFGVAGSWRQLQILHHALQLPLHSFEKNDETYLVLDVIAAIKNCIGVGGESIGLLIGYRQKLYRINSDFGVFPLLLGYDAIGSGDDIAKGALYALTYNRYLNGRECLKIALNASVEHTPFVRQPYVYECLTFGGGHLRSQVVQIEQTVDRQKVS
jgi:ATP-dependent protease HslVU (ClpYQ) peptidase subunit